MENVFNTKVSKQKDWGLKMRSFKKYVVEIKKDDSKKSTEKEPKKEIEQEPIDEPEVDSKDSEIGEWTKNGTDWVIHFVVNGTKYSVALSPLDDHELHWKYTYYKHGQRDSSDIKKFGDVSDWLDIWTTIVNIIKDFIRIFSPNTLKFIGMSSSKRTDAYKDIFKLYIKNLLFSFKKLGYHSSFDYNDINISPSFVVRKGSAKEPEKKKEE